MLRRRFDGKMIGALLVMLTTVCLSAFAGLRSGDAWSLNPSDFRYDMSLYFELGKKDYENLDAYEIGAFIDDECRGIAEKIDFPDGGSCLYMRIRSNSDQPDVVTFLLRNKETGATSGLKADDGNDITFKPNEMIGLPSQPLLLVSSYSVTVKAGEHGSVDFTDGLYKEGSVITLEAVADEGYHFVKWSDGNTDATREITVDSDIELTAEFAVSSYKVTFKIGEEVILEQDVEFGAAVKAPEAPGKEGYTFAGWGEIPETMPAEDLSFEGSYTVNSYKLTFKIGDEVILEEDVEFGAAVTAPEAPEKEGYTFAGWGEIPETMPAEDLTIEGKFNVNSYKVSFKIGDEVILEENVEFGAEIKAPEAPEKEGYTFAGWGEIPETMPAEDLSFEGRFNVNSYKVTFKIDDEVILEQDVEFGAEIKAPEAPEKEGYTFAGWGEIPETMPAEDLSFEGSYTVNSYKLTFKIGDEVILEEDVEFGAEIKAPEAPEKEGFIFDGWSDMPETMPAHDVVVTGTMSEDPYSSVDAIGVAADSLVTVFTLDGRILLKDVKAADLSGRLAPGLYIINGKKVMVR